MEEEEEFSKLSPVRKCPVCGGDLDRGFLTSSVLHWDTKRHTLRYGQESLLTCTKYGLKNLPGLRCVKCKVAIFDYEFG